MRNKLITALSAAALTATLMPVNVFAYWTGGYEVIIDGESVANVKNAEQVKQVVNAVNEQLSDVYGVHAQIEPQIELKMKILASEKLTNDAHLHNAIASASEYTTDAVRIIIEGTDTVCVRDAAEINNVLNIVTDTLGIKGADNMILEEITMRDEVIPHASLLNAEQAAESIILNELLSVSSKLTVSCEKKYVPTAKEVENPDLYEGVVETISSGRGGKQTVTQISYFLNGELQNSVETTDITDFGEPATIAVGTKERPAGVGTGKFISPASGRLTSGYGSRWGRTHNGLDIAAPVGTPVYASDDGIVSCSEYKNSFGNLITIDHQNGYETYYAHNSQLLVSVGQTVKKGQLIAKMGSTGRSTGSHCHFEIHYNGEIKNPSNYL